MTLLLSGFWNQTVYSANKTFTGPGNFSTPANWGGSLPGAGDNLRINGSCVVDNATPNLIYGTLDVGRTIAGTLSWPVGATAILQVSGISSSTAGSAIDMTNGGTLMFTGAWITTNQTFTAGTGTIVYNRLTGTQTVIGTTYNNLTLNNTSGTNTAGGNIIVNGILTTTAGGTLNMTALYTLSGTLTTIINNGIISTAVPTAISSTPIKSGQTWGGTIIYNAIAGLQTVLTGTYNNLTLSNTSGTNTASGSISINGTLTTTAGGTFADAGNTITILGNITNNGTHSGSGKIYFNGGTSSHTINGATSTFGNVELDDALGATWSGTGTTTVSGTLTVTTGTLSLGAFTTSLAINGATSIAASQTLSITSVTGTHNFNDVTVNGIWSNAINEAVTISGNLDVNTGATFTAGTAVYTFSGIGKTIGGTITSLTFDNVTINGTYTNNILSTGLTVSTALAGAGTLTQGTNSFLNIGGTSASFILTTTLNTPNTVVYNGSGTQTIKVPTLSTYYHLIIASSNIATLGGATTVNGNLTVSSGTLADGGFQITGTAPGIFSVESGASYTTTRIATPWFPTLMTISLNNNSTVNFNGTTGFTLPATPATYGNLGISGAVTKTLAGVLAINGTLTLTSGILAIAGFDLTLGTGASISGTFSASNMITSSGGNIIKQFTSVPLSFTVFPLGTGAVYTPADINISSAAFGGTGNITIRAIAAKAPNQFDNTNSLSKYWTITTTNISNINATLDFTYVQAEADATYEPAGSYVGGYYTGVAPWEIGTDDYTLNVISFTKTAASNLTGDWTAGREYGLNGNLTYYSRATGSWETIATWSNISHVGAAATQTPPAGSNVDIGGGFTVTKTTSTALSIGTMQIDANGTLNMGTQTGLTITTLNGDGTIQLGSGTFPAVTTNNFNSTSGSSVVYNTAGSFTLPASPANYSNLTVSTGGTKTLGSDITVNENLNILTTATLADGGFILNVKGNVTNNSTHSGSGKIYLNGTSSQIISGSTNLFGNIELDNSAGASFSGTGVTTVNGNLTSTAGTLSVGAFTTSLTVSGSTTITSTLNLTSITGTHTFTEFINNGTFNNNTVNEPVTINGNMQNNGTFNSGSGIYTLNGLTKILSGTLSFTNLTIANTYANNGTLNVSGTFTLNAALTFTNNSTATVSTLTTGAASSTFLNYGTINISTALGGTGAFTNSGASAILNTAVLPAITTLNASSAGNTVNYNGTTAHNIKVPSSSTYHHLTISGSNTKTLAGAITVNGDLRITGGTLETSTFQITGNSTGTFAMSSGTSFTIGLISSTTNVDFPTLFQVFDINAASTVSYVARFAQVISCSPTYGNLTLTTGNTTITKTLSGPTLNIAGDLTIQNGARVITLAIANNTANIAGNLLGDGPITFTTGTITIGGSNNAYTGTETMGTSLFKFNGSGTQIMKALNYYNLEIDKTSGIASFTNNAAVSNNLNITNGTLQLDGFTFSVTGATNISGNLTVTSATGTKLFNNVTITGTGNWNVTAAVPFSINGNLQNDGIFTSNSGAYTFTGPGNTLSGLSNLTFDNVTINTGAIYTTTTNTIITTALSGVGSLTVGTNNSLTLSGTCTVTTFIPNNNNATVYFNSTTAGQTIPANTYYNLVIDKSSQTATSGGNITVSNNLSVTSGGLTVGANNISVTGITNVDGTLTLSSATGTKTFADLNINSTGTLNNSGNANVTVNGNLLTDGTITPGSGTYTFAGTGKTFTGTNGFSGMNGNITGTYSYDCATNSSFGDLTVGNQLTIVKDRGLSINTSYTNNGTTLVDAGPNGHSGSLITPAAITNTGTCSFKSSIAKNTWHCISSSVTNAQIETVFSDLASHNNNFYRYDETSAGGYWVQQTTGTMNPGQGYYMYYFSNKYKTHSGTYNSGPVNVALTYSAGGRQGWNFVGNPYPSAIDWDAIGWTKTNIENAVYIKNGAAWDSYVGGIGNCRYIYPGQGFFVKALSGGGSLGFATSVQLHRNADNLKNLNENNEVTDPVLHFSISNDSMLNNTYLRFKDDATTDFDRNWDANKIFSEINTYPELFFLTTSNDSLSINSTPFTGNDTIIPLGLKIGVQGTYKIKTEQILNFDPLVDIFIEDAQTSLWTNIKEEPVYSFASSPCRDINRFFIHFIKIGSNVQNYPYEKSLSITNPYDCGNRICFVLHNFLKSDVSIELVDVNGKVLYYETSRMNNTSQFISIDHSSLNPGYYFLKITNPADGIVKKVCLIK